MKNNKDNKRSMPGTIQEKMGVKEMVGYGFTDMAGNLLFCTFSQYILWFYTEVCGLPEKGAFNAGLVLFIACFINAILSVVWGSVIDHTRTKWGQSRPWFLFLAGPFAVTTWLAFFLPSFAGSVEAKFGLAMLTYVLASGCCYCGLSAAMSAVLPNLTANDSDRVKASSFRMIGGSSGAFITSLLTMLIVPSLAFAFKGSKTDTEGLKWGYWILIGVWAVMACAMLILAFMWMKERNFNPKKHEPMPLKKSFKALKGNHPWFILAGAFILLWIAQNTRSSQAAFFAKELTSSIADNYITMILNSINVIGVVSSILTPIIVTKYKKVNKFNKTSTLFTGLIICCLFGSLCGISLKMSSEAAKIATFFTFYTISVFGLQMAMGMYFMMFADTVDYGEWKTGIRAPGLLASVGAAFGIQMGSAFGFYVPNLIKQSTSVSFAFIWFPVIVYALSGLVMILFIPYERKMDSIRLELSKRNK